MTTPAVRRILTFMLAAPLALGLAACGDKSAADPTAVEAAPVKPVPAPAGTSWRDTVQVTADDGYLVGNPDAPIKLVEYGSLTCPTCARFGQEGVEPLLSKYVDSGRVSFELRNFAVHGPVDIVLARMVRCGSKEAVVPLSDQVWQSRDQLMAPVMDNQDAFEQAANLPMDKRFIAMAQVGNFFDFFASRGISSDQAKTCLADVPELEKLANDTDTYAKKYQVNGTPTFALNGNTLDGVNSWATLEPVLQNAGAR